jgi:DNA-binding HxlR family transcriptional regulator
VALSQVKSTKCVASDGAKPRPGAWALTLISAPLNYNALKKLEEGPCGLIELRRALGSPPQSTMRVYMNALLELGLLERRRQDDFPGTVEYEITRSGRKLLAVAEDLQHWLHDACYGPISLGTPAARRAVKALIDGWSTNIIRALAARPLALTELHPFIPSVTYPTLERRLTAMRHAGLVEAIRGGRRRGIPYKVSNWLRRSVSPLTSAVGWENVYAPHLAGAIGRIDVEATFLLAVPILELASEPSGRCRLSVELRKQGAEPDFAGVSVDVHEGRITSCVSRLEGEVDAWVCGSPLAWFRWVTRGDQAKMEIGGNCELAHGLADGIHLSLVKSEAA